MLMIACECVSVILQHRMQNWKTESNLSEQVINQTIALRLVDSVKLSTISTQIKHINQKPFEKRIPETNKQTSLSSRIRFLISHECELMEHNDAEKGDK